MPSGRGCRRQTRAHGASGVVIVKCCWDLRERLVGYDPSLVISVMGPGPTPSLPGLLPSARHIRIVVHEITSDAEASGHRVKPALVHVKQITKAARAWNRVGNVVIHCGAGVSRAPAAALIIFAAVWPEGVARAAHQLRRQAAWAALSKLLLRKGGQLLDLGGPLLRELISMGPAKPSGRVRPTILAEPS